MILILDSDETTSSVFTAHSQWGFVIGAHAGGTWQSEIQTPDGDWVVLNDTDYTRSGAWVAPGFPGAPLRFTGGTQGAKIWLTDGAEVLAS